MKQFNCGCTFTGIGQIPDNSTCRPHATLTADGYDKRVHPRANYRCDECACLNYAPRREPKDDWPACVCGHAATAHN